MVLRGEIPNISRSHVRQSKCLYCFDLLFTAGHHVCFVFDLLFTAGHLPPIFMLVYSWQRLELDCWPLLLEELQEKYDMDAAKVSYNNYLCNFICYSLIFG